MMYSSQPSVIGWSIAMAALGVLVSVGITLAIVFFVVRHGTYRRIDELEAKLKGTIYDVNVQNAANKEGDDQTAWFAKNVLLSRIQNIESAIEFPGS
jgi:hypothetical protein